MKQSVSVFIFCVTLLSVTTALSRLADPEKERLSDVSTPTNLTATEDRPDCVKLTWDEAEGAKEYTIYRAAYDKGTYYNIGISKTSSYEDRSATPNRFFYYKVRSFDYEGYSRFTKPVRGRKKILPETPGKLKATTEEAALTLSWKEVPAATRYYVYRSNTEDGNFMNISFAISPEFVDKGAAPNREYYYKIRAWNSAGFSEYSDTVKGMRTTGD